MISLWRIRGTRLSERTPDSRGRDVRLASPLPTSVACDELWPSTAAVSLTRSEQMARIRGRDTAPEMRLRRALWRGEREARLPRPQPARRPSGPGCVGEQGHRNPGPRRDCGAFAAGYPSPRTRRRQSGCPMRTRRQRSSSSPDGGCRWPRSPPGSAPAAARRSRASSTPAGAAPAPARSFTGPAASQS